MLSICFPLFCSYSIFSICNNDNSLNLVFAILSIFSVFCFHPKLFLWHYFFKIFQGIFRDLPLSSFFFIIKMFFFVLFLCFVSFCCFSCIQIEFISINIISLPFYKLIQLKQMMLVNIVVGWILKKHVLLI